MKGQAERLSFRPTIIESLRNYSAQQFKNDLVAGLIVGVVSLPLAMAFGIASGVKPEAGLFTAIVAGFVIAILGGSRYQISGPTGAFVVVIYGIVSQFGVEKLPLCTVMAGLMLLIMGLSRLGSLVKYMPYPVTMGFTTGIAVIILMGQIKDFFGLSIAHLPADAVEQAQCYWKAIRELSSANLLAHTMPSLAVGLLTLFILVAWPKRYAPKIPTSLIALVVPACLVALLKLPVPCIIDRFPKGVPQALPTFHLFSFSWADVRMLFPSAFTIALLGAIESLLSAVVADGITDTRHDSNQELVGQGIGNIVCPFLGGIPATGAIARTATSIRNGAATPIASIINALVLMVIIVVAAPLVNRIPLTSLSAVLMVVAFNMGEWHEFARYKSMPRGDYLVLIMVFALTLLVGLTLAIEIGLLLAILLFIKRISEGSELLNVPHVKEGAEGALSHLRLPEGVQAFRIQGAFFFGTADKLETALRRSLQDTHVMILILDQVLDMDASGLNALESLQERLEKTHSHLLLCNVHHRPLKVLIRSGFLKHLGKANVLHNLDEAVQRARELSLHRPPGQNTPLNAQVASALK